MEKRPIEDPMDLRPAKRVYLPPSLANVPDSDVVRSIFFLLLDLLCCAVYALCTPT